MQQTCKLCERDGKIVQLSGETPEQLRESIGKHMEDVHHIAVQRAGETWERAAQRFIDSHPDAWPIVPCPCVACGVAKRLTLALQARNN